MTLTVMLIVWLITVSLIPITIKTFAKDLEEAQEKNPTSFHITSSTKVMLAIPFLGTGLMILLWVASLNK